MKMTFNDIFIDSTKKGRKILKENYHSKGKIPIIDQGKNQISGFSDEKMGIYKEIPVIIFGDHTRIIKYVDYPFLLGADGVKILSIKTNKFIAKYLYYALLNYYIPDTGYNRHFKWLKNFTLNVNSIDEQKRIVIILDKIVTMIDKKKKQINLLEELVKSRFIEMFFKNKKYIVMTLEQLTSNKKENLVRGPFGGSLKKDEFIEDGYLVYEQKHAIYSNFNYQKYYISKEKYQKMLRFKVESGDLIVSCSGTLGKIAEIPKEYKEGIINQALLKIKLDKNIINNKFFMVLFRMKYNEKELQRVSLGSGISNFPSMKEVRNFDFIVPPLWLQNEFAEFATKIDKLKFEAEKSLKEMENLYESLMQKFFKQN